MGDDEKIEEVDGDEQGAPSSPGGSTDTSKIVKILLFVAGGILLIFMMIGISFLVSKFIQERSYQKEQDIVVAPPPPPLSRFDVPTFATTTNDPEPHFTKITITLGHEDSIQLGAELNNRVVQIQHIINIILKGKKYDELQSQENMIELGEDIKAHINVILISGKVKEVYFKEFIIN